MTRIVLPQVGDLTAFGRDRGSGTAWPTTDLRRGDSFWHTGVAQLGTWDGTRWRLIGRGTVADAAARDALTWAYPGLRLFVTALGQEHEYQGATPGWTRPWGQAWGQLGAVVVASTTVTGAYQSLGDISITGLPKNRRVRRKARATFYTASTGATTIRLRVEAYRSGASVDAGSDHDLRIGGSAGDLAHPYLDEEYVTTGNGDHGFSLWAIMAGGVGTSATARTGSAGMSAFYIEDVGPAGPPS